MDRDLRGAAIHFVVVGVGLMKERAVVHIRRRADTRTGVPASGFRLPEEALASRSRLGTGRD